MHPSFIFLLTLLGVCTATFFGGGSTKSLPALPQLSPPHVVEHVHVEPSPKVIKVILQSDHSHDHSHDHGHGHDSGHAQIIKVIHENSAHHDHGHDDHAHYVHGHDDSHGHGSHGSNSKFLSILPQILQIVLADEGRSHGHGHDHGHNHGGSFFSTVSHGADFYKGGHVIEKGELKLTKIPNNKNYDDLGSSGGKVSLLSSLFSQQPSAGPPGWSSSGSSGWSSSSSGWSSSGPSGWSSGWD